MTEAATVIDRRAFRRLTPDEAARALYLDFEGNVDQPPVLVGILRRGGRGDEPFVQQEVLDPAFGNLGLPYLDLRAAVEKAVVRAEARDRRIVTWSEHDLEVVRGLGPEHRGLIERFERRYANARRIAAGWLRRCRPDVTLSDGRLSTYLALIDYGVPERAAPGSVGSTIRALRPGLESGRSLTVKQRERWERLLAHNRHDCAGMKRVCVRATQDLDELATRGA